MCLLVPGWTIYVFNCYSCICKDNRKPQNYVLAVIVWIILDLILGIMSFKLTNSILLFLLIQTWRSWKWRGSSSLMQCSICVHTTTLRTFSCLQGTVSSALSQTLSGYTVLSLKEQIAFHRPGTNHRIWQYLHCIGRPGCSCLLWLHLILRKLVQYSIFYAAFMLSILFCIVF